MDIEIKPRGRKRKPDSARKKARQVYATDDQWRSIEQLAQSEGSEISPFVIKKALE